MDGEDKVSGEADWVVKDDFGEDCGVSAAEVDAVEAFLAAVVKAIMDEEKSAGANGGSDKAEIGAKSVTLSLRIE